MLPRKLHQWFAFGTMTVILPSLMIFSGLGFIQAHGQQARREALPAGMFHQVRSVQPVCDGSSLCFEFGTTDETPLWILLQNRPNAAGRPRTVLVSRTPGFENPLALKPGSKQEAHLLRTLEALAERYPDAVRVRQNLVQLNELIASRTQPCSTSEDHWFFY